MQIVYISNRPAQLIETIAHVEGFMPFIAEGVVIGPECQRVYYGKIQSRIDFTFIAEEEILGGRYGGFQQLDHQKKNFLLRTEMARHHAIKSEFIMSDDDARPLKTITQQFFKQDQRYHSYYFYDLADWCYGFNAFDVGQQNTCQILKYHELPHLSYASHMPQIINQDIFLEMARELAAISQSHAVCEWSSYFNYAQSRYPEMFHEPRPFQTLCWPENPTSWPLYVKPDTYSFENFSPHLYTNAFPFSDFKTVFNNSGQTEDNLHKILCWYQYELKSQNPLSYDVINSLPLHSFKKLVHLCILPVKKIVRFARF